MTSHSLDRPDDGVVLAITFQYYRDLPAAMAFYEGVLGFELAIDQGWSKIYRIAGQAHVGLVDEVRGMQSWAADKTSQLCLALVTRDGRYQGRMEFSLPPDADDFIELTYPTQFRQQLLEANEPYLAVLAGLSADCDADETVYIPTAWKRPDALSEIQLIINAGNLDAYVVVPVFDGGARRFECERVATSPTIAFNRICTIELAEDLNLMGTEIRRDDFFGNPLPPVAMPIAF